MLRARIGLLLGLMLFSSGVALAELPVRGWLIHTAEPAYIDRVLKAAPSYGINHLDLSHDFVDRIDDIMQKPGLAELVERTARRAGRLGITTYVWSRELNTLDRSVRLDPGTRQGRAFWDSRRAAYRQALARCPSVAGVVIMFGSCPTEVWDPRITDPYWNALSWAQRVRFVTRTIRTAVCGEMRRDLWVRDFNHGPKQLQAIVDGLRDFPGITVYSKAEPQDFQLFYPHSFSIGAFGRTPQVLELDLNGEYWGQSLVPVSLVGYLRHRLGYGVRKGIRGAVGRIDTGRLRALGTPSEINLYAFSRILHDPSVSEQAIYDGWLARRYGLKPGSAAARRLQAILVRTLDFAKCTYYTLGFWTPKNQSSMPSSLAQITSCIAAKSNALWDPKAAATERRLLHPDPETVAEILAEKTRGIEIADRNAREFGALRATLKRSDYETLSRGLSAACEIARLYRDVARAYWLARLAQEGTAPVSLQDALRGCADDLVRWADRIEESRVPLPGGGREPRFLRSFASQVRSVAATLPSSSVTIDR